MAFQSGLSGLNAAAKELDVVGNNIANSSTSASRARARYSPTCSPRHSTAPAPTRSASAPRWRASSSSSRKQHHQHNNALDVAVNGNGFYRMSNNGVVTYSRNGQFHLDAQASGDSSSLHVTGYSVDTRATSSPPRRSTSRYRAPTWRRIRPASSARA